MYIVLFRMSFAFKRYMALLCVSSLLTLVLFKQVFSERYYCFSFLSRMKIERQSTSIVLYIYKFLCPKLQRNQRRVAANA